MNVQQLVTLSLRYRYYDAISKWLKTFSQRRIIISIVIDDPLTRRTTIRWEMQAPNLTLEKATSQTA